MGKKYRSLDALCDVTTSAREPLWRTGSCGCGKSCERVSATALAVSYSVNPWWSFLSAAAPLAYPPQLP